MLTLFCNTKEVKVKITKALVNWLSPNLSRFSIATIFCYTLRNTTKISLMKVYALLDILIMLPLSCFLL